MRWLCLPNEPVEGFQIGIRMAFEKLHREGIFSAYMAYSYLVRKNALQNHQNALNELLTTARDFAPDVIFIAHPSNDYPMEREYLQHLKNIPSKPKLVYFEGDAYDRLIKCINNTMKNLFAESDMCFMVGTGSLSQIAYSAGAKNIRYVPHSYDTQRFGNVWKPTLTRRLDAIMIANLPCLKRIPWLFLPGGRGRKHAAQLLYKHLGERFAVYGEGQGWDGLPFCKGRIAFDKQDEAIRDAWMSVNWGQYDEIPMYFSDRLPISLACGVPHITNYQPGYEHVIANVPGLFIIKKPQEALDVALYILSLTVERRNELGFQAAEYARNHLESTVVFGNLAKVVIEQLFGAPSQ
jgi:hypothetical protein